MSSIVIINFIEGKIITYNIMAFIPLVSKTSNWTAVSFVLTSDARFLKRFHVLGEAVVCLTCNLFRGYPVQICTLTPSIISFRR